MSVVIIGGGLAGLTLAIQLRRALPSVEVCVVDSANRPAPEGAYKVGESVVEIGSFYLREHLGLAEHLRTDHLPKLGLRFFMPSGGALDSRLEYGVFPRFEGEQRELVLPTYNVDRGRLENHLFELARAEGVELVHGRVDDVEIGEPHRVEVHGKPRAADWLIDASGFAGVLKRHLGIHHDVHVHRTDAVWFRTPVRLDPERWSEERAFRSRIIPELRWTSTNHLVGAGYWVWLIPIASGGTSVGIVTDPRAHRLSRYDDTLRWLHVHEPDLATALASTPPCDFHVRRGGAYSARRLISPRRWALSGDAGAFLDPLYSPGTDFIAITNHLIVRAIASDLAGERNAYATYADQLLQRMFDYHLMLYRDYWSVMRSPEVMATKVAWDTATYFAFNLLLFQSGSLFEPGAMKGLRSEVARVAALQHRAQALFRRWSTPTTSGFVDQFAPDFLYELYLKSRERESPERVLRENLEQLEDALRGIERRAGLEHPPSHTDVDALWAGVA